MNPDDILYDRIKNPDGTKRVVHRRLNDYIDVEFEVTTQDGEDEWEIKTITVTSSGPPAAKVIVDTKTIIDPTPPVYHDDCCYSREQKEVRNEWTPSDFGFVGYGKD
jgi:hypothetical protein